MTDLFIVYAMCGPIDLKYQGRLRNSWMQALHWPGPRRPCTQCWLRPPGDSRQRKEAESTTPAHWTQPSWYGSTCQGRYL